MSIDQIVADHHKLDFQDTTGLAFQQFDSTLRSHVDSQGCEGEASVGIKIFHAKTAGERTGRLPQNRDNRTPRSKRWLIYRDPVEDGEYIEDIDMWKQAFDPTSDLMTVNTASVMRAIDERIINDGMFGSAWEGKSGASTEISFPTANIIPADLRDENDAGSGNVGLNVKKLREAKKRLMQSEVFTLFPSERPKFGITAQQMDDLFQYATVTSKDYNLGDDEKPVLMNGVVKYFMGFEFVCNERWPLKTGTTDVRLNCAWVKPAVKFGTWSDVRGRIWNDGSVGNTPVMNVDIVCDARRMRDDGVFQIECLEPS